MITQEKYSQLKANLALFNTWLGKRTSYSPSEVPNDIPQLTNEELTQIEVFEFVNYKPDKCFVYVKLDINKADTITQAVAKTLNVLPSNRVIITTFTGAELGKGHLGHKYSCPAFGQYSTRYSIRFQAINGCEYYGTYYFSSGDYARVKKVKK